MSATLISFDLTIPAEGEASNHMLVGMRLVGVAKKFVFQK
jgi:hypothetical protein